MKGISGKHCHVLWVPTVCVCLLCVLAVYADLEIFANPPLRPGLNWGAMNNPGLSLKRKSDTQSRSSEQAIRIFVSDPQDDEVKLDTFSSAKGAESN